ncbi:glycosyltransferase [Naasia lichenicola]|nr:nucleotide disphospho-sugar-binding domain-containing protein [Naasia lichenicola]
MAAAQKRAIPTIVVSVIASGALVRPERVASALAKLAESVGLAQAIRPHGEIFVVPFHPLMRDPTFPTPPNVLWMQPDSPPLAESDGTVLATLGTEFNTESGTLFPRILDALSELDSPARVAVGRDLDPRRFGPQPDHVRVEQYIHFDDALPRASVVLHHGGSGMLVQSLLAGVPQIIFPMGADQPFNASMTKRLGIGLVLDAATATPTAILEAVRRLRTDAATRDRVSHLRRSMLDLPNSEEVVAQIQRTIV